MPESGRRLISCPSLASGIHEEPPETGPVHEFWECTDLRFKGFLWTASHYIKGRQDKTSAQPDRDFHSVSDTVAQHTKVSSSDRLILAKYSFLLKQIFFLKYMTYSDFPLKKEIWELGVRLAQCLHQWQGSCHTLQVALGWHRFCKAKALLSSH